MDNRIHITVPGRPTIRDALSEELPGIVIHYTPSLHPEEITTVNGIPVTSVARTLLDCAESCDAAELRALFIRARARGLLDVDAVRRSRARVEWRPSLEMFDRVFAEFDHD